MYRSQLEQTRSSYLAARELLIAEPRILIDLERTLTEAVAEIVESFIDDAVHDYDEASTLYPFWQAYPPDARGRAPVGDQFPWIEVGEHAIGRKLARGLPRLFQVSDLGFPTGPDERFLVRSPEILQATGRLTDTAWLTVDIKSAGPRDDFRHTVMSHNQVSGSGEWDDPAAGVSNRPLVATGKVSSHPFYPALPPLLILDSGLIAPTITMAIKPVYDMLPRSGGLWSGQPLRRVDLVVIPNGLLLCEAPNYLAQDPTLLFPGKDDKGKNPLKVRARVSFEKLEALHPWRVSTLWTRS